MRTSCGVINHAVITIHNSQLKSLLDSLVRKYNTLDFIELDPISVPHGYNRKQDIEIAALIAAIFSWGQRTTIINKSKEFLSLMDNAPHDFILNHRQTDLKVFLNFKHRTFNATDALYFISFFRMHYEKYESLEEAFILRDVGDGRWDVGRGISNFRKYFFSLEDYPERTKKHISSPDNNSTCKRINMFLRWMVRQDNAGVDFGIWNKIKPSELICPIDVHVFNIAKQFGLINTEKLNWNTAVELTERLREFDKKDPVKYDFALFGFGIEQKDKKFKN